MIGNTNDRNVVSGQNEVSSAMADDIPPEIAEHMFALISDMKVWIFQLTPVVSYLFHI